MSNARKKEILLPETVVSNEVSFEEFYHEHWSALYLFAYNILRDQDIAKDVVQEVFIPLINNATRQEIKHARSFLVQAVKYQIYALVRAEKVRLKAFEQLQFSDYDNSTNDFLREKELRQQIDQSVNSLPDKCQTIFTLKQEGHTAKAIAAITGLSQRTVEHQLYIATKKLRYALQGTISLLLSLSLFFPS
jgi:RNA polymerase sigma factor (sigma-70 family)